MYSTAALHASEHIPELICPFVSSLQEGHGGIPVSIIASPCFLVGCIQLDLQLYHIGKQERVPKVILEALAKNQKDPTSPRVTLPIP